MNTLEENDGVQAVVDLSVLLVPIVERLFRDDIPQIFWSTTSFQKKYSLCIGNIPYLSGQVESDPNFTQYYYCYPVLSNTLQGCTTSERLLGFLFARLIHYKDNYEGN